MIDRMLRVFNLGASVADKFKIASFYTSLFFARRIGMKASYQKPWHVCIRFEGKTYDVYLKYLLDIHVFREMFIDEHYRTPEDASVKRVMDLGANIGASLIYLMHRFPSATAIAVEPHPACLEVLRLNAEQFGDRVQVLPCAVCQTSGEVTLYPNGDHWSASLAHRRGDDQGFCVPCSTFDDLANRFGSEDIDFVKCDIEGAEFEIFNAENTKRIKHFIGEIHPSIAKKTVAEFTKLFPSHEIVREGEVGDHIHLELKRDQNQDSQD